MIDNIIDQFKSKYVGDLTSQFDLNQDQAGKAVDVAGETLNDTMSEGKGNMLGGLMNLFSKDDNNADANSLLDGFKSKFVGNLISKLGISESVASAISAFVGPKLINMVTESTGGDITDMLKGSGGGMLGGLDKKLGDLF